MFILPDPKETLEAAKFLNDVNQLFTHLLNFQKKQFGDFWMPHGQTRSKEEINKILEAMDESNPGQSAKFFQLAYQLSQNLLALEPQCLTIDEYTPKYQYEVVNGNLRVI